MPSAGYVKWAKFRALAVCLAAMAVLGGLLLYQVNWGVALALGMIGTATIVFQHWNGPKPPPKG